MRLLAISDLHLGHPRNREGLDAMPDHKHKEDWLIIAGDVGEKSEHLRYALDRLIPRFAKVIWTPGNHDLWCPPDAADRTRGQARYDELVAICRSFGALTPEDPYAVFPPAQLPSRAAQPPTYLCPLFCLYDYSFHPADVSDPVAWAKASGVVCGDEWMLSPEPWPSRSAWCDARVMATETRLRALPADAATILISHWPLRSDLARPPRVPRFSIWCGTTRTEDWPTRFRARAVVNGHLHMRTSLVRHGIPHLEVSLGYPRDWTHDRGVAFYLREVLPDTDTRFVPARDPFMIRYP
jgi:3',5'-cyclic AMP phosphodiesterase CpdA